MGTLYLVATPIGNLEDITLRAIKILQQVDLIAAEDTRTTRALLSHYDIHTRLISHHKVNEQKNTNRLLELLAEKNIALVSDAGTPVINDPGYLLVKAAIAAGIKVVPIPGVSSPITALSVSGLPADEFTYIGYLPHKSSDRRVFLEKYQNTRSTIILFETPHRIIPALEDMLKSWGNRNIAVCREMTKLFEEILRGSIEEVLQHFQNHPPLGEFTLVVDGNHEAITWSNEKILQEIKEELMTGEKPSVLAGRLADASGHPKKEIYSLIQSLKE